MINKSNHKMMTPIRYSMDDHSIWSPYERNRNYYHKHSTPDTCPTYSDFGRCSCRYRQLLYPLIVGGCGFDWMPNNSKPSMNRRCYIGFGEQCPICIQPILHKKTAWLTPCGHAFHRKCLLYAFRHYLELDIAYSNVMPCPICRNELTNCCIGEDTTPRYNISFNDPINDFDYLENFWTDMEEKVSIKCLTCNHILGSNASKCKKCQRERNYLFI
jgi:Ring finger domain